MTRDDWLGGAVTNRFSTMRAAADRAPSGRPPGMEFRNGLGDEPAMVHIYDEIGWFGITAQAFIGQLAGIDARDIDVHISSPGGEIFDGIAIMNALRDHPANVTVYVDSLAASIASVIAMAGDRVVMAPHSEMMIHDGLGMCGGNAADMREMADMLDRQSDKIAGIYAERAGGTANQWRGRMKAETWYSAEEAVAAGLADEVSKRRAPAEEPTPAMAASWDLSVFRYPGRAAAPTALANTATPTHHTDTVDNPWDDGAAERNLPSPVPLSDVRAVYGWYDGEQVEDGAVTKAFCKLPHHEVDADGQPGPANLAGVRNALARLPQSDIPEEQRAAVEAHLRAHLEDAPAEDHATVGLNLGPGLFKDALTAALDRTTYDPDTFRSILSHEANNAPAVVTKLPDPVPETDHYDSTRFTRALKEAAR